MGSAGISVVFVLCIFVLCVRNQAGAGLNFHEQETLPVRQRNNQPYLHQERTRQFQDYEPLLRNRDETIQHLVRQEASSDNHN